MSEVCVWFLLLLMSESCQNAINYKTHRLSEVCHGAGRKVRMTLGDSVHVFTHNSSLPGPRGLTCHLELAVTNSLWGFSVYLQEIALGPPSASECDPDNYVQFGRDILFITTHLSPRLCHNHTDTRRRHYTEIQDTEMDVWLVVSPNESRGPQSVVLVVTPVHKSAQCKEQGGRVHMCDPRGRYCISRQLLCDGRVNCVGEAGGNTDESDCQPPVSDLSTKSSWEIDWSQISGYTFLVLCLLILSGFCYRRFQRRRCLPSAPGPPSPSCPPPPYTIHSPPLYSQQPAQQYQEPFRKL